MKSLNSVLVAGIFLLGGFPGLSVAQQSVSLMQNGQAAMGWTFDNGAEFPGAKGSLVVDPAVKQGGKESLKLEGNFTGGGNYVQAAVALDVEEIPDIRELSFWLKGVNASSVTIRLIDATGCCHQFNLKTEIQEDWQRVVFPLEQFFAKQGQADAPTIVSKYEAWGGGKGGQWTGPAKSLVILVGKTKEMPIRTLWINDVSIVPLLAKGAGSTVPPWRYGFEEGATLGAGWKADGSVTIQEGEGFKGMRSLLLQKKDGNPNEKSSVSGPAFPVSPGSWTVQLAAKTELTSMDSSYNGSAALEFLDRNGSPAGQVLLYEQFRVSNWQAVRKQVEIPAGAATARFTARINKETPGKFWLDELSAEAVAGARADERVKRIMFTTAQLGNLLLPGDSRQVTVEVWSSKALEGNMKKISCTVRDYWGAEQALALPVDLVEAGKKDALLRYEGKLDLSSLKLETGRYFEIHGAIEREGSDPVRNYTSFAILPEAPNNVYKPEEVPFTSRNWDNRLEAYVLLTKRLGIRICGVWGKMEADMAKTEAPRLDQVMGLGMGYLTGSPAGNVEQRVKDWKQNYNEENLRKGVRNYFEKFGKSRPVIVNLGNEPHSKGEDVKADVEAYRIVYTEIKKIDPSIFVVGTSVGVEEDYFKAGFGEWCDAYDFHVYEDALSVRNIVSKKYPEMFKKYGHAKPVWSTELGLNSQGMARQFVAAELYRKFAHFFAGGGANVSWFGLLYPDSEGKDAGSFGSAHNVFDCRYNKYAPKLDAVAYFNAVNAIGIKKFVQDKVYGEDMHAFLFRDRDNRALQIWYKDKGREDLFIPLPGVQEVQVIRIDGTRSLLQAGAKGITLTVNEDPFLLLYEGGEKSLPEKTAAPAARIGSALKTIVRGAPSSLEVILDGLPAGQVVLKSPPLWEVKTAEAKDNENKPVLRYTLGVPEASAVREADLIVSLKDKEGKTNGELSLRPPVTGAISMQLLPMPQNGKATASVKLVVQNNSSSKQEISWDVALKGEQELKDGAFAKMTSTPAYFSDSPSGVLSLEGKKASEVVLPLADIDLFKVYHARASVRDSSGRTLVQERPVSAFYGVAKAKKSPVLDGVLDEEDWKNAPVRLLDKNYQFYAFPVKNHPVADWKDVQDLSAEIRYLWDDAYFYVSVSVTDDKTGPLQQDSDLWQQDGLQFLIDPMRTSDQKIGKYDYAIGVGKKGPQAWCYLSADGAAPGGNAMDIKVAVKKGKEGRADLVYEIAFPWSRLGPFKPVQGGNLGFTLIVNEDDGNGRDSFMTWFGNAHSKDIDTVGDLILLP